MADELDRHAVALRDVIWGADADLLDSTGISPALFAVDEAAHEKRTKTRCA